MKEHQRTDRLTLITIVLVIIIGAILITYRAPKLSFEKTPEDMLQLVQQTEHIVSTDQIDKLTSETNVVFVDIRNKGDYVINHIKDAINIPLPQILDEENLEIFEEEEKQYILYGVDHTTANGVWMLLRQLGFENVRLLLGGFNNVITDSITFPYYYKDYSDVLKAEYDLNLELEARAKEIAKQDAAKMEAAKAAPKPTSPSLKKKVVSTPVLPPPPVEEEEEEEEGC